MAVSVKNEIAAELDRAHDKLREVDDKFNQLTGRPSITRRLGLRNAVNGGDGDAKPRLSTFADARENITSGRRTITSDRPGPALTVAVGGRKRQSLNERFGPSDDSEMVHFHSAKRVRRSVTEALAPDYVDASDFQEKHTTIHSVVMPTIDTKSRDDAMKEMATKEKSEIKQRNRRMFANMLGTLKTFGQRKSTQEVEMLQKQQEVERKLEDEKMRDKEDLQMAKRKLLAERRDQNEQIRNLQRKKAQVQIAEREIDRMTLFSKYIQLSAKPSIFYMPGKHTLRTLELQKNTKKKWDEKMAARREMLDADLKSIDEKAKAFAERGTYNYGERPPARDGAPAGEVRPHRRADGAATKMDEDDDDDDEDVMKSRRRKSGTPMSDIDDEALGMMNSEQHGTDKQAPHSDGEDANGKTGEGAENDE